MDKKNKIVTLVINWTSLTKHKKVEKDKRLKIIKITDDILSNVTIKVWESLEKKLKNVKTCAWRGEEAGWVKLAKIFVFNVEVGKNHEND